jgi:oligopeptidase B
LTKTAPQPRAPHAAPRPTSAVWHGIALTDEFAWLRDRRWQAVMRDPSLLDPDIRAYLEAENAYAQATLAPTEPLQDALFAEMRGRIKEDDAGVPAPDGPFAYFSRHREGGQHPLICREPRAGGAT